MQNKNGSVQNKIQGNAQKADIPATHYSIYRTDTFPTHRKRAVAHSCNCSLLKKIFMRVSPLTKFLRCLPLRAVLNDVIAVRAFGGTRGFDDLMSGAGLRGRCLRLLRGLGRTRLRGR